MPEHLATIETCCSIPFTVEFTGDNASYELVNPPSWLTLTYTGPGGVGPHTYDLSVAPNCDIASWIFQVNDKEGSVGTVLVVVEQCTPDKTVNLCVGEVANEQELPEGEWTFLGDMPYWVNPTYAEGSTTIITAVQPIGAAGAGVYSLGFWNGEEIYIIEVTVTTSCHDVQEVCCDDPLLNIAWYNPTGGWSSYVFTKKNTVNVEIGVTPTFKIGNDDGDRTTKKQGHQDVFDAKEVVSGHIPFAHLALLKSLKYSIQVYLYNSATSTWDIPVVVDGSSFKLYKEREGIYRYDFTFRYAEEIIVQTQ